MSIEKLLKNTDPELRFEVAVRGLTMATEALVLIAHRLSDITDRFDEIAKGLEAKSWEKAINAELDRREKERESYR